MDGYHAVNLVSKNVDLLLKWAVNGEYEWLHGTVVCVFERGVKNGQAFTTCNIEYDDGSIEEETLWEKDYDQDGEDSWKFTQKFAPLIEHVLSYLDMEDNASSACTEDCDCKPVCECTTCECGDDEDDPDYDENEDDYSEDEEDDDESDFEPEYTGVIVRRKPSFLNQLFATLFAFSPLIATFAVLYNARHDVGNALCTKYCVAN